MRPFKCQQKEAILFKNGRLLDPENGVDKSSDILVEKGKIVRIAADISAENIEIVDARGLTITPGWFDMHVHFREPGREDEETIKTGCAAAAAGGFTGACPMPNTEPAADSRGIIEFMIAEAKGLPVEVHPIAATTKGRQGMELSEMADLLEAGAVAFSDDGVAIKTAEMTRRAMEYASMLNAPIIEHCEEPTLTENGAMHEGAVSSRLGIPGMPGVAEDIIVARDILLAQFTGARLHIAHISTARAVELVRRAKADGIPVTCEVMPHHFCLTDEAIETYDANFKMNPPLRTKADVAAIIAGLRDGTIDVIATDHAPHSPEEKDVEFSQAPFGIIGLETAFGLMMTELVKPGHLSLPQVLRKMTTAPRQILRVPPAALVEGAAANLTVVDLSAEWTVDTKESYSKSRNTPFVGWKLTGKARGVYNRGIWWQAS